MSRSNNVSSSDSPVVKYMEWSSDNKCLTWFNKEKADSSKGTKGEKELIKNPFTFLVLDETHLIGGYSDSDRSSFWSNAVKDISKEELIVKTSKGTVAKGLYADIKDNIKSKGAKYAKGIFIAYYEGNELVVGHIKLIGSGCGAWMDFCTNNKGVYDNAITITGTLEASKGRTVYYTPVFQLKEIKPETNAKAVELDKELQKYLSEYFKTSQNNSIVSEAVKEDTSNESYNKMQDDVSKQVDTFTPESGESDDLPF